MMHFWQIGEIEFCAIYVDPGWLVSAVIGQALVMEEEHRYEHLTEIMSDSAYWVMEFSRDLHTAAHNFNPSDYL